MRSTFKAVAIGLMLAAGGAGAQNETSIEPPPSGAFYGLTPQFAVSPNGRDAVFVGNTAGGPAMLWHRQLGTAAARPLAGTEQASYPFWSADNRFVGFFSGGKLKTLAIGGGSPLTVCDAPNGRGGAWNADDVIVFASGITDPLRKVSAAGGQVSPASVLETGRENSHRFPQFLPDGTHILFWAGGGSAPASLKIGSLGSTETVTVGPADTNGAYAAGLLFFGSRNALMAQPFDVTNLRTTGEARRVVEPLSGDAGSSFASFAVSADGTLLYTRGAARPLVLTWFDRSGKVLGRVGEPGQYTNVALSPDGKKIAVSLTTGTPPNRDIWVLDAATGAATRITDHPAVDASPIWSPDGLKIMFSSQRDGPYQTYVHDLPTNTIGHLFPTTTPVIATDWARNGLAIAYTMGSEIHIERPGQAVAVLKGAGARDNATFAPPHHLRMAFQSTQSGRSEVYVSAVPPSDTTPPTMVSTTGGSQPLWARSGTELFCLAADGSVMSSVDGAPPQKLFTAPVSLVIRRSYAVTSDGQRVLMPVLDDTVKQTITVTRSPAS